MVFIVPSLVSPFPAPVNRGMMNPWARQLPGGGIIWSILPMCPAFRVLVEQRAGPSPMCRSSDRKSTRLNSGHITISYAVFCLKKKKGVYAGHRETRRGGVDVGGRV